jgi:hypothetical protein
MPIGIPLGKSSCHLRLEQFTSLVEVPLADCDARHFTLAKSEVLLRKVYPWLSAHSSMASALARGRY